MNILVAGDNPNHLGGHAEHNPFRLWVKLRFRELLHEHPDARLALQLHLGPGQWCAEVAVEEGRKFDAGLVPDAQTRWHRRQFEHYEALVAAGQGENWNTETELLPAPMLMGLVGPAYVLSCWDGERRAAPAAKVEAAIEDMPEGTPVQYERLMPTLMPVQYKFLGAMEELRDLLPDPGRLHKALEKLSAVAAEGEWPSEESKKRASGRITQGLMVHRLVVKLHERK